MRKIFAGSAILLVSALLLTFNNCGRVSFNDQNDARSSDGTPSPPGDPGTPPPITTPDAIKGCAQAQTAGKLKSVTQAGRYESPKIETGRAEVCEFGVGDNLAKKDGAMQARYTKDMELTLPANAVLCDLSLESSVNNFHYDDIFFLVLNGKLLATDNQTAAKAKLSSAMADLGGGDQIRIYDYDWLKIRGAAFENKADDYCLGLAEGRSTCAWPVTEQSGKFSFKLDPKVLIHIGLLPGDNTQTLSLVITGDNDSSVDCNHDALEFQAKFSYYIR